MLATLLPFEPLPGQDRHGPPCPGRNDAPCPTNALHVRLPPSALQKLLAPDARISVEVSGAGVRLTVNDADYCGTAWECDHTAFSLRLEDHRATVLGHPARCQLNPGPGLPSKRSPSPASTTSPHPPPNSDASLRLPQPAPAGGEGPPRGQAGDGEGPAAGDAGTAGANDASPDAEPPRKVPRLAAEAPEESQDSKPLPEGGDDLIFPEVPPDVPLDLPGFQTAVVAFLKASVPQEAGEDSATLTDLEAQLTGLHQRLAEFEAQVAVAQAACAAHPDARTAALVGFLARHGPRFRAQWRTLCTAYTALHRRTTVLARHRDHLQACGL